ncbi:MAG: WYL domain-containing protein [Clostridia bacterium]|nr:WYL domain-containing protein [Clostridia bacterium]
MAEQSNRQKIKLVRLLEILQRESDEMHPLRKEQICERLNDYGISCNTKTLARDLRLLNSCGYEIMQVMDGHEKIYYVADRSFSVPELKILIDAVEAATFITEKKTGEMIEKIASLGGSNRARLLTDNRVLFNARKHSNESIYYNVNALEDAIAGKHTASFRYFDLNEAHERIYRKEKQRYVVEPLALVYLNDNYYLMCYSSKYQNLCNYRVDRMDQVQAEDESISEEAAAQLPDLAAYTEQVFKMYGGRRETVTLRFGESLIAPVYDKFGEDLVLTRVNADALEATLDVEISPPFWGWLFQFAGEMTVIAPQSLADEYASRALSVMRAAIEAQA